MQTQRQKEHEWLHQLIGEWQFDAEASMKPGQPPDHSKGTEVVRSLGGLWILAEGEGDMPGCGPATSLMTLGFDTRTNRFTGTWIGSMMTHLWLYDGELNLVGNTLTLDSQGPAMKDLTQLGRYRDVIEIVNDGHRTLTSHFLDDDGLWRAFMLANYRRTR
ncbi:DUF1579 domain-containing protein [Paludibaculum fermentans]|uniref:DUF1579 domain-containing protein n=1 Tax=Paludibaculum fermentans TaxID=1473598 RepID=A0A7S7NMV2_PALFE|nr:DUF1579 domain-containing protein [Paludibaculum fermentans]QOY86547.1 DUF1579 domain-containing protein [Paludibaculum fermentans]